MENIYYDVFATMIEYLDGKSLLSLCSSCKRFHEFGERLAKERSDLFTIFRIERNIKYSLPIQDDPYYSVYINIKYFNSKNTTLF